ncbi:MAG: adenylate/guanylate cyclase domain-containing protein [Spirulinaceae cyanobacterium]
MSWIEQSGIKSIELSELGTYDQYMRSRPQLPKDERIVIVGIDEADLQEIGQGIIADEVYARLLKKIKDQKPRAIGLDIYRDLPVPPGEEDLVKVFESTDNLVGIEKVIGDNKRERVAPPPVLAKKGQVGANNVVTNAGQTVRRGLLSLHRENGEVVYGFAFYLALLYLDAEGISPENLAKSGDIWRLGDSVFSPLESYDGGYVNTDAGGYQILLNYRGAKNKFSTYSLTEVLNDQVPKNWGRDRIVMIGAVGESFNDNFFTPFSGGLFTSPEPMPGVEIHAPLTSQILSAALNNRPLISTWSEPLELLWILFWSGVGSVTFWQGRYTIQRKYFLFLKVVGVIIAVIVLVGSTYLAFLNSWWLPVVPPLLALVGSGVTITAYVSQNAGKLRKTFGRYLTDEVVANLLENPQGLELGGKRQKITILTSDLRGFTALSERLSPKEVVKILNIYLEEMLTEIANYRGTVDKFMGDGILVLFGVPTLREDDAQRAIACGIAMQLAMAKVNSKMKQIAGPILEMGIGINTGECVAGNIGSEKHTEYTVIGNQVNLTFRIETYTTGSQILISESTLEEAGVTSVKISGEKWVQSKGVKKPITVYEVGGIEGKYNLFLNKEEELFVPIPVEIPLLYQVVSGKQLNEEILKGSLVRISAKGAEIRAEKGAINSVPESLSNIKLNLLKKGDHAEISEDIYAKVLEESTSERTFCIKFTAMPPAVSERLDALYKFLTS